MSKASAHVGLRRLAAAALCLTLSSCTAAASPEYEFIVRTESDPGVPLAGVRLLQNGALLGSSDRQGLVALSLAGTKGEAVELEAACPEGFRAPARPLSITLRTLAEESRRPEYQLACAPLVRTLVLAVRAENGPNLPLMYLGRELARTDAAGAAHALLEVPPGETVTLSLDTSASESAALMPQNPELKLTMPGRDEVVLFDQTFTKAQKRSTRRKDRQKSAGPTRIGPRKL